jgi:hypothetical protein
MSNVKNQHYVPQSYLKSFTDSQEKIYVFDKFEQKCFSSNVKNVASERYFYDFPQSENIQSREQTMEKLFSQLEAKASQMMSHLYKKIQGILSLKNQGKAYSVQAITQSQKVDLSLLIAIQAFRTKEFRLLSTELLQKMQPSIINMLDYELSQHINRFESENFISLDESFISEIKGTKINECLAMLSSLQQDASSVLQAKFILKYYAELSKALLNHIWLIGINDTEELLLTSDHPVVKHQLESQNLSGYSSEGIEVVFPLNSKLVLILFEKDYFKQYCHLDGKLFPLTRENIIHYNSLQVFYSYRFVFSQENNFQLVQNICQEYPDVCSSNRERFQVNIRQP